MAGFGGFLGGLGEGVNSFVNMRAQEQEQELRAALTAQQRMKTRQAQQALQNQVLLGNYALAQPQPQGTPPPPYYQPPGPSYQAAPPAPSMPAPGSGAPGASFAPVNPGAPPIGAGGRPMMAGPSPISPAASLAAPGAAAARAPMGAGTSFGLDLDPMAYIRRIAQGVQRANPHASPAEVYSATMQHISTLKPMALMQYRNQGLALRAALDAANIGNKIRDLDIKQQAGASKTEMERELLSVREEIADQRERGADQRQMASFEHALAMVAAKAGLDPTKLGLSFGGGMGTGGAAPSRGSAGGGVAGALGAVAGAARANKNAKRQSADDDYHLQAKIRSEANQQIDAYLRKHNGAHPLPGDLDFPAFTTLQNRRHAAAEKMTKLRAADPRLPAWNNSANSLTAAPSASQPPQGAVAYLLAHPTTAAQFDAKYGPGTAARILGQ